MAGPEDPITELAAAAAQLHELYEAYRSAGFSEQQAFDLTKEILINGIRGQ
ncbi:hypothetical protein ACWGHD_04540 [Streptomyces xanthophaeus]